MLGVGPSQAKFDSGKGIAIKITPVRDLPDGFASQPATPAPALGAAPRRILRPRLCIRLRLKLGPGAL